MTGEADLASPLFFRVRLRFGSGATSSSTPFRFWVRSRPRLGYFSHGSWGNPSPVRQRLLRVPGVREVTVEQTWEPHWDPNRLADQGRRKPGTPERRAQPPADRSNVKNPYIEAGGNRPKPCQSIA